MDERWLWIFGIAVVAVVLAGAAAWLLARRLDETAGGLGRRISRLPWRSKGRLAWLLLRDRRIPMWLRAVIPLLVLYLAMPLDIIPDFVPVLGHLDDIVVVLVAVAVLVRFTPGAVLEDHIGALEAQQRHGTGD